MTAFLNTKITRRCRPLLGTFVDIALADDPDVDVSDAFDTAFAKIKYIESLMSVHDPNSELSRLNLEGMHREVALSAETYSVLKQAKTLYRQTDGVFDVSTGIGTSGNIHLLQNNHARFSMPITVDLGGIAKGFAVDEAIALLEKSGLSGGLVNAGGDLRYFGEMDSTIVLRHQEQLQTVRLSDFNKLACATSSPSEMASHRDGRNGAPISGSVTVMANTCMIADALTKVVMALGEESGHILAKYEAIAFAESCSNEEKKH